MKKVFLIIVSTALLSSFSTLDRIQYDIHSKNCVEATYSRNSDEIRFYDYKLFLIYTRDSIMRELLATQLMDFCHSCSYGDDEELFRLNWEQKIYLNDEELIEILTDFGEYSSYFNILRKEKNEFYVNTEYLNYRPSRNSEDSVLIFPDFSKLNTSIPEKFDTTFGVNNKWNKKYDKVFIDQILTDKQNEAYQTWNKKIGPKKTIKVTRNKIVY